VSDDIDRMPGWKLKDEIREERQRTREARREADDTLTLLSAALDEIYALRTICAYEEGVVQTDTEYKSFPKSRRRVADDQMARLRAAVAGGAQHVSNFEIPFARWVRDKVDLLTVDQWRDEVARRNPPRRRKTSDE
jgi:hypothetical protein